jgi:hypothetical protein
MPFCLEPDSEPFKYTYLINTNEKMQTPGFLVRKQLIVLLSHVVTLRNIIDECLMKNNFKYKTYLVSSIKVIVKYLIQIKT